MSKLLPILLSILCLDAAAEVWFQTEKDGSAIECPDVVVIDKSEYEILNDCYGLDPKHPVIESGVVVMEKDAVSFVDREVSESTFLGEGQRNVQFKRSRVGDGILHLSNGSDIFYFRAKRCVHSTC